MEQEWIKIADSVAEIDFAENNLGEILVEGKRICIGKFGDIIYACGAKCPHAGAAMVGGYIDAVGNIVCPSHRYKFSLQSGKNVTGEGYYLATYEVKVLEEGVFISFKKKKSFFDFFN